MERESHCSAGCTHFNVRVNTHTTTHTHTHPLAYILEKKNPSLRHLEKPPLVTFFVSLCSQTVSEHIVTPLFPPPTPPVCLRYGNMHLVLPGCSNMQKRQKPEVLDASSPPPVRRQRRAHQRASCILSSLQAARSREGTFSRLHSLGEHHDCALLSRSTGPGNPQRAKFKEQSSIIRGHATGSTPCSECQPRSLSVLSTALKLITLALKLLYLHVYMPSSKVFEDGLGLLLYRKSITE